MTTNKTAYHENQVADRVFANSAPTGAVDGVTVALWSTSPTNAPSTANEVSGDSYSPVNVTASGWSTVNANNPRQYDNDADISFGVLDTSAQKTVAGVVLYEPTADTSTGNALYYGDLASSKTVAAGDEFKFAAGDLDISES